jgi:hypothetical protein
MPVSPHFSVLGDNPNIVQLWLVPKDHAPGASARMCAASSLSSPRIGTAAHLRPAALCSARAPFLHRLCLLGVCVSFGHPTPPGRLALDAIDCDAVRGWRIGG